MRTIINVQLAVFAAIALTACALLQPIGRDEDARQAAKLLLAAYETTQQGILIYGRLPPCDENARTVRFCRNRDVWSRIKVVEVAATRAIAAATPVLNGSEADAGQLLAALQAIESVKDAIKVAHATLKGATP